MSKKDYRRCSNCYEDGVSRGRAILTLPSQVHCKDCGRELGTLSEEVNHYRAIRAGDTVNDYKTGDVLAEIEYDSERVIEHD